MNILYSLILILFLNTAKAHAPQWVNDNGACSSNEICVVGSGTSLKEATEDARAELAKYFQTKVSVNNKVSNFTNQIGLRVDEAKFSEWTSKAIETESEEIIVGAQVVRSEQDGGTFYVLMSQSKTMLAKMLKERIEKIDNENNGLDAKNTRFVYPMIWNNLTQRQFYLDRYNLVSLVPINSKITLEKISQRLKEERPIKIGLYAKKEKMPPKLMHLMEKIFSPLKIVFVPSKQNPDYKMRTELIYEDEYFKVEGFKKLNIIFKIELADKKEKVLGRVSTSSIQTARSKDQCLSLALEDIENQLRDKLDQLVSDKTGE